MRKKIISAILVVAMLFSCAPALAAEKTPWRTDDATGMPFNPPDNYVSHQNSPGFQWPYRGTKYDLKICYDREMTQEVRSLSGLEWNFYIFEEPLPSGVDLYWMVRYWDGSFPSEWSDVRKFRIDPDADVFTLPSSDELLNRVSKSHPRIWCTPETLAERRNYKNTNERSKQIYDYYYQLATEYITQEYMEEPKADTSFGDYVEQGLVTLQIRLRTNEFRDKLRTCGFIYLISGERKFGEWAAQGLVSLAKWDVKNGMTSYYYDDMNCVWILLTVGMVYDWVCDLLTAEEKALIFNHVRERMEQAGFLLDSLPKTPQDSHGWTALEYMGIMALGLYGDMPEAEEWLKKALYPIVNILPPYSYEDGGWSQGTYYWRAALEEDVQFFDVVFLGDIYNIYDKTWLRRHGDFFIYAYPQGSLGSFGDDSNNTKMPDNIAGLTYRMAAASNQPDTKWFSSQIPAPNDCVDYFYAPLYEAVGTANPHKLPQAKHFKDIGWVTMHSNVADDNRVMMTFCASPFGTYGHGNCQQNAFIIEGYGENLAIHSGYYDSFQSRHNKGFTRKTYAHNTVTINGGKGQLDYNPDADAKVTSFITGSQFDACTGDATQAYFGRLKKYTRTMIYIRPDQFIVIDDLEAGKEGQEVNFEWWLNAEEPIRVYEDGTGANIQKRNAELDAKIHYPSGCTPYYTDRFSGPDLVHVEAGGSYKNSSVDTRVWFETPKTHSTKMVVTMDVHTKDNQAKYVKKEEFADHLRLTFEDGTVALINLGENTSEIRAKDGIHFCGEAVVYNDEQVMLVNGTSLKIGGKAIIESKDVASVSLGCGELLLSSRADTRVTVDLANEYASGVKKITDSALRGLVPEIGITTAGVQNEAITMDIMQGEYSLRYAKNRQAGNYAGTVGIDVIIDGKSTVYPLDAFYRNDGGLSVCGDIEIPVGKYTALEKNRELNFDGVEIGKQQTLNRVYVSTSAAEGNYIRLQPREETRLPVDLADPGAVKAAADAFVESESYDTMKTGYRYSDTLTSGGEAVTQLNGSLAEAAYTIEVKEAGYYDIYVNYCAWEAGGVPTRSVTIGGRTFTFDLPLTGGWGISADQWKAARVQSGVYLEAGRQPLVVDAGSGMWNYDWIALKKAEGK